VNTGIFFFYSFLFFPWRARGGNKGLVHAKQSLCHWATAPETEIFICLVHPNA
jgi:hypothetical protein